MIYTVGDAKEYRLAAARNYPESTIKIGYKENLDGQIYVGSSVWKTREEAQAIADKNPGFEVFALDADWGTDTRPSSNGDWHDLLVDAVILELEWNPLKFSIEIFDIVQPYVSLNCEDDLTKSFVNAGVVYTQNDGGRIKLMQTEEILELKAGSIVSSLQPTLIIDFPNKKQYSVLL